MTPRPISAGDRINEIRALIPVAGEATTVADAMAAICTAWGHIVALENAGVLALLQPAAELFVAGPEHELTLAKGGAE